MKLQRELESLDDLPEEIHENYEKGENGKFMLKLVEGLVPAKDQDTFDELKGALDNERKLTTDTNRKLRELVGSIEALGGLDALKELKGAESDRQKSNLEKKGEYDRLLDQVKAEHLTEIEKLTSSINGLKKRLDREIRGRQIAEAISELEGNPNLLQPILMSKTTLVGDAAAGEELRVEIQEDGVAQVDGDGKLLTVKGYVERLRSDDAYAGAFKGTGGTGGGGSGETPPKGGPGPKGGGDGMPPELANFRRSTCTNRQKVDMLRHLEKVHNGNQPAIDSAYLALPE